MTKATPNPTVDGLVQADSAQTTPKPTQEHGTGRWAKKHGARSLARHLTEGKLDGRTFIGKALRDLRLELAADAGGLEHLTARERLLVDRCAAAALVCMSIENHLFTRGEMIEAGELLPILRRGYVSQVQSLSRMLQALGLRPERADKVPSLGDYLAQRSASAQPALPPSAPPTADTEATVDATDAAEASAETVNDTVSLSVDATDAESSAATIRPRADATEATTE